jgi:hypothetical protein
MQLGQRAAMILGKAVAMHADPRIVIAAAGAVGTAATLAIALSSC